MDVVDQLRDLAYGVCSRPWGKLKSGLWSFLVYQPTLKMVFITLVNFNKINKELVKITFLCCKSYITTNLTFNKSVDIWCPSCSSKHNLMWDSKYGLVALNGFSEGILSLAPFLNEDEISG